jgi:hypothetical protein
VPGSTARAWSLRLSTDAPGYCGKGEVVSNIQSIVPNDGPKRLVGVENTRSVRLPEWSAAIFASMS